MDIFKRFFFPVLIFTFCWVVSVYLLPITISKPIIWLNNFISIGLWASGGVAFNRTINFIVWDKLVADILHKPPPRLLVQLSSFIVFLIIISSIFYWVFDYELTAIWAASGAISIIVGFALKNLILDTFSGLAIHLEQPFKVGDWISCHTRMGNYHGFIEETNWRTTRLLSEADSLIIIPNSYLTNTILTNHSKPSVVSEHEQELTIDFSVPTERAFRIIDSVLLECTINGFFLDSPKSKSRIKTLSSTGVVYTVGYYLNPDDIAPQTACNQFYLTLLNHLSHAGITVSYPKLDIYSTNMPWRQKYWEYTKDVSYQLGKLSLFKLLSEEDIKILSSHIKVRQVEKGESIVCIGDQGSSMFIVAEGFLEVLVANKLDHTKMIKVSNLSPGDFFGEKSMLTGEARSATVKVLTNSVIAEINKDAMKELYESNDQVLEILSRELAQRELNNQLTIQESYEITEENLVKKTGSFMSKIRAFVLS